MRRFAAPVLLLAAMIVLARLAACLAPYLVGTDTLAEQVNGTLPAGMLYVVAFDSLSTLFNLAVWFCIGWLVSRILKTVKERSSK